MQRVSVLFNEPKLLKSYTHFDTPSKAKVSVLFNEPKLLKFSGLSERKSTVGSVSVLFNEPKLLK